jgi:Ca2+-binding RTX toxin-like protein
MRTESICPAGNDFPLVEALEGRRLLSASIVHDVLTIFGTPKDDTIKVGYADTASRPVAVAKLTGNYYEVSIDNVVHDFPAGKIHKIVVSGGAGNDTIAFNGDFSLGGPISLNPRALGPVQVPAVARGGAGNDTLVDGAGPTTLMGGAGNDSIYSVFSNTVIGGGSGNDRIELQGNSGQHVVFGGTGNDTLYGSSAEDELFGGSGQNVFYANPSSVKDLKPGDMRFDQEIFAYPA